ncbi:HlyD family secretion protein [Neolewinella agarilytica]|uniref:HlyD family secretion protein n=1 Tax=Neolewinella agarilytica TaxID=478744 RepID=A0A1H9FW66_9BACT|nr:hypothetical protein [Neolewinella agarilytica]SEQ42107.1 hypothetical protein SAMN05444359_109125 [Neolewinella agarilytica]
MPNNPSPSTLYRDAAIQDMMGSPPGWLLHSGLTAIAVVFIVALGLAALIRYPEKVEAPFLLQTEKIPLALHAGAMNVIDTVFATSGAPVTPGDTLLVFQSEADWRPVRDLDRWLTTVEQDLSPELFQETPSQPSASRLPTAVPRGRAIENFGRFNEKRLMSVDPTTGLQSHLQRLPRLPSPSERGRGRGLGSRSCGFPSTIQTPLTTLNTLLNAHQTYLQTNGLTAEITAYEREIADAQRLSQSLNRQVDLYEQELDYQQRQTDRMQGLEQEGIVSTQDAEQVAAQTIAARRQREVLVSSDIQNQLRVQQLRQQILQRKLAHREQLADFDRQLRTQLKLLRTALTEYRDRYFLIAREAGTLTWQPTVREQATVSPSEPLGFLRGDDGDAKTMVARLQLPSLGQGKIELGDRVILDFAAYPSREYGQVEGSLRTLDPIALPDQQGNYLRLATVALPDTLVTSYGKTLPFQYNLAGTARIITADRSLLARLFDQFLNLTKNT